MDFWLGQLVVRRGTTEPVMRIRLLERLETGRFRLTVEWFDPDDPYDDPYGEKTEVRRYLAHRLEPAPEGALMTGMSGGWAAELISDIDASKGGPLH